MVEQMLRKRNYWELLGIIKNKGNRMSTNKIKIVRELSDEEIDNLIEEEKLYNIY